MNNVSENPISEYFRPYPAYEDVFYDDIENHKKHFLPVCSVNLKFLFPERDEWVHFIATKDENPGDNSKDYFTKYTRRNMYSFDIIDGKYKFEAPWEYFWLNRKNNIAYQRQVIQKYEQDISNIKTYGEEWENWCEIHNVGKQLAEDLINIKYHTSRLNLYPEDEQRKIDWIKGRYEDTYFEKLEKDYQESTKIFNIGKQFYQKYGQIYPKVLGLFKGDFADLEKEYADYLEFLEKNPDFKASKQKDLPEFFGFITDIKAQSQEAKKHDSNDADYDIVPICYNVWQHPLIELPECSLGDYSPLEWFEIEREAEAKINTKAFEYMGCITEYYFRYAGATVLNAFHDHEAKKATMLLDFD